MSAALYCCIVSGCSHLETKSIDHEDPRIVVETIFIERLKQYGAFDPWRFWNLSNYMVQFSGNAKSALVSLDMAIERSKPLEIRSPARFAKFSILGRTDPLTLCDRPPESASIVQLHSERQSIAYFRIDYVSMGTANIYNHHCFVGVQIIKGKWSVVDIRHNDISLENADSFERRVQLLLDTLKEVSQP